MSYNIFKLNLNWTFLQRSKTDIPVFVIRMHKAWRNTYSTLVVHFQDANTWKFRLILRICASPFCIQPWNGFTFANNMKMATYPSKCEKGQLFDVCFFLALQHCISVSERMRVIFPGCNRGWGDAHFYANVFLRFLSRFTSVIREERSALKITDHHELQRGRRGGAGIAPRKGWQSCFKRSLAYRQWVICRYSLRSIYVVFT